MQEQEKKIPDSIKEILPNMELFTRSSEDYISSLEMAVNLLQREVENLRSQIKPQFESIKQNQDHNISKKDFLRCSSYEQIHSIFLSILRKHIPITESNFYLYHSANKLVPLVNDIESELLGSYLTKLVEEGIIDWAVEKKELSIIPNIYRDQTQQNSFFIIIPFYFLDSPIGFFLGISSKNGTDIPNSAFSEIAIHQENVAMAIDNLRSSEEMLLMNNKLAALNSQMIRNSKLASVGELTQAISNEMSSPLQIIKANIKLMKDGVGDQTLRLDIVCKEIDRIADLNNQLNSFGEQIAADKSPEPVKISKIFEDVLKISISQFQRDGIAIETKYEDQDIRLLSSKAQLQQAFLNILFFSRDTMPEGGKISIVVSNNKNKYINILISDNGNGIDEKYVSKCFEPTFSDHYSETKIKRGLFWVKKMVEQHNGIISVLSEVGKGTAFRLSFPIFRELT
jgi:signal transduction histidine kinase